MLSACGSTHEKESDTPGSPLSPLSSYATSSLFLQSR